MTQKKISLSIIIIAFNEEQHIGPCLDAIAQQTMPPDEVILVDNNSTDNTVAIARKYPFVTIIHEKQQGMIWARNAGFDKAKGDLLGRIDADSRINRNWVERVHIDLDNHQEEIVGLSGPQYLYAIHNTFLRKCFSVLTSHIGFFTITKAMLGHETLFGSNMVITKKAWQTVRDKVCTNSQQVHEDVDLALHLGTCGTILFDRKLQTGIASRAFLEDSEKRRWRLETWITTITLHRKLFVGWSKQHRYATIDLKNTIESNDRKY